MPDHPGAPQAHEILIRLVEDIIARLDRLEKKLDDITRDAGTSRERLVKLETQQEHHNNEGLSTKIASTNDRVSRIETKLAPIWAGITMAISGAIAWLTGGGKGPG